MEDRCAILELILQLKSDSFLTNEKIVMAYTAKTNPKNIMNL